MIIILFKKINCFFETENLEKLKNLYIEESKLLKNDINLDKINLKIQKTEVLLKKSKIFFLFISLLLLTFIFITFQKIQNCIKKRLKKRSLKTIRKFKKELFLILFIIFFFEFIQTFLKNVKIKKEIETSRYLLSSFLLLYTLVYFLTITWGFIFKKKINSAEETKNDPNSIYRKFEKFYNEKKNLEDQKINKKIFEKLKINYNNIIWKIRYLILRQEFISPSFIPFVKNSILRGDFNFKEYILTAYFDTVFDVMRISLTTWLVFGFNIPLYFFIQFFLSGIEIWLCLIFAFIFFFFQNFLVFMMNKIFLKSSHQIKSPYDFTLANFDAVRSPYNNIDKTFEPFFLKKKNRKFELIKINKKNKIIEETKKLIINNKIYSQKKIRSNSEISFKNSGINKSCIKEENVLLLNNSIFAKKKQKDKKNTDKKNNFYYKVINYQKYLFPFRNPIFLKNLLHFIVISQILWIIILIFNFIIKKKISFSIFLTILILFLLIINVLYLFPKNLKLYTLITYIKLFKNKNLIQKIILKSKRKSDKNFSDLAREIKFKFITERKKSFNNLKEEDSFDLSFNQSIINGDLDYLKLDKMEKKNSVSEKILIQIKKTFLHYEKSNQNISSKKLNKFLKNFYPFLLTEKQIQNFIDICQKTNCLFSNKNDINFNTIINSTNFFSNIVNNENYFWEDLLLNFFKTYNIYSIEDFRLFFDKIDFFKKKENKFLIEIKYLQSISVQFNPKFISLLFHESKLFN